MPSLHRRSFVRLLPAAAAIGLACAAEPALAQVKGLEIIAPASPGSGYDQASRAIQQVLQEAGLASGIQVQNIPGGGGTIGLAQFVTAKKRSPTLLTIGFTLAGAVILNKSPVSLDDAKPLALLYREYEALAVPGNSDIKTAADLMAKLKADPGSVSWGLGSAGGIDHINAGLIAKTAGVDPAKLRAVHFAGGGEQIAAALGGHVTVAIGGLAEFLPQVEAGGLRLIALSAPERLPGLDVPTLKEQGIDVALPTWRALMASPQMSEADRKAVADAIAKMVATPAWKTVLAKNSWQDAYLPADGFAAFLDEQQILIAAALKDLGLAQ